MLSEKELKAQGFVPMPNFFPCPIRRWRINKILATNNYRVVYKGKSVLVCMGGCMGVFYPSIEELKENHITHIAPGKLTFKQIRNQTKQAQKRKKEVKHD